MRATDPGSARQEAERLVATVLAAVRLAASAGHGADFATGSAECCVCPVCRAVAALRDPSPEFAERLATGVGDLAAGLVSLLQSFAPPQPSRPQPAPDASAPGEPTPDASARAESAGSGSPRPPEPRCAPEASDSGVPPAGPPPPTRPPTIEESGGAESSGAQPDPGPDPAVSDVWSVATRAAAVGDDELGSGEERRR